MGKHIILIVTSASIPNGGAATTRKLALNKGFIKNGYEVKILSFRVYKMNEYYTPVGRLNGTEFVNFGHPLRTSSRVVKLFAYVLSFIRLCLYLLKDRKHRFFLWSNTTNWVFHLPLYFVTRLRNSFYFCELNESPIANEGCSFIFAKKTKLFNFKMALHLYDRVFVMTHSLKNYLYNQGIYRDEMVVINNAVDLSRFTKCTDVIVKPYVTFVGSFSVYKDGIDILIRAFAQLPIELKEVKLRLLGFSNSPDKQIVLELIEKHCLKDRVELLWDIPNDNVPPILLESYLLALTRVPNELTTYGFPTKLVEYLASGRPVLVTKTSDICNYLTDGISAYIPMGYSDLEIRDKIVEAFKSPQEANAIGIQGRKTVISHFNPEVEARKIINTFIEQENHVKK